MHWSSLSEIRRILSRGTSIAWLKEFYGWRKNEQLHSLPSGQRNGDTIAIVLSYKRPQNMETIVSALLKTPSVSRIILSNNNPACHLERWYGLHHPAVEVISQPVQSSAIMRFRLARAHPASQYLIVDDDLFLSPHQYELLCSAVRTSPDQPHGMFGQRCCADGNWVQAIHGCNDHLDVISRVYALTHEHLQEFFRLFAVLGMADDPSIWQRSTGDDVVLSFTGTKKPLCHDIGPYLDCPTQGDPRIATWQQSGFFERRQALYHQLCAQKSI